MPDPVSALPDDLQARVQGRDIIVFDGECVLCSGFFQFMLARDAGRFQFVIAQSELGGQLYKALDLPQTAFETNLVIVDGQIYQRLDAFAAAMRAVGAPWSMLAALRWLPRVLKDPAYHLIARNRYRLFGRFDTCMMPDPSVQARFLDVARGAE